MKHMPSKTKVVQIRITMEQKQRYDKAAAMIGCTMVDWARRTLDREADPSALLERLRITPEQLAEYHESTRPRDSIGAAIEAEDIQKDIQEDIQAEIAAQVALEDEGIRDDDEVRSDDFDYEA